MAKVDLVVGIGAEYKGKPAFKKALTDTQKLTNSVKSLAKGYVGLLGAQKALPMVSNLSRRLLKMTRLLDN